MKRIVHVCLGASGRLVGELRHDRQGARENAAFAYAQEWLAATDRFAIDPALPLVPGFQFHRRTGDGSLFHNAIADTEPDGWGRKVIVRDHAKRREAARTGGAATPPVLSELDFLLAVDDVSRLGALRLRDEHGDFQASADAGRHRAPPLIELRHLISASRAVEASTETAEDLAYLRGKGTSLGGLRPKCSVIDDDGRLSIGKFPSIADERAVTKGEVLALHLARKAGITTAEARLVDSDGVPVALIRRFDRGSDGERIPYVSAATMLGVDRGDQTQHTYTEIVDALRVHGAEAQRDIEELWRRIAFSIRIANVDDHLHNHGFLYAGDGHWQLSPAFDLNPFPERERELKTWISEEAGPAASIDALMTAAPYFRVSAPLAKRILREVEEAVIAWRSVGAALGMTAAELDQFAEAFATAG
ncbi:MAG: type II toxin-antitoxin system HipA family toxin [Planctomycetes bacterium]|nr:type II toxin-antitoxin system HipA family toxin [Planctomycetota bacterium]